ncbi:MAG TPA: sulfate adenylyltransferase [Coriobacteriia bacterium]|jgi:sulfate adenylyltransferase
MIAPHGGVLIDRTATGEQREELRAEAPFLQHLEISVREACDLELIGNGAFSPLTGFLGQADYERVAAEARLADGTVWPLPVTLAVSEEEGPRALAAGRVALAFEGTLLAVMEVAEAYPYDREREASLVFGTTEEAHPGVAALYAQPPVFLGGDVMLVGSVLHAEEPTALTPAQTRAEFERRGWKTVTGFQTRNPIHRAHEYLLKSALEVSDGLLVHPLVGHTKIDDIPASVRMKCYRVLLDNYFPAGRVLLSPWPAAMRYAGPREALFHALVRKNYGCTHFIVGRDHAGVGDYYGTFAAQEIFGEFSAEEIGITLLMFEHAFWCNVCDEMATAKTCPHGPEAHLSLSGTKVRALLASGVRPPERYTRREIGDVLVDWALESSI